MIPADMINGSFEVVASLMILNHCRILHRDKLVRGVSALSTAYFFMWGMWNLYYYPHLDQWWSFIGGALVAVANCLWLGLLLYYQQNEKK